MITAEKFGIMINDASRRYALLQKLKQRERVHGPWMEMGNKRDGWNREALVRLNNRAIAKGDTSG